MPECKEILSVTNIVKDYEMGEVTVHALRERVTELTTLSVLGMSDREIGEMLLLEQAVLFGTGILMGIPGNLFVRTLLESMMQSDSYVMRLPLNIGTCGLSFLILYGNGAHCLAAGDGGLKKRSADGRSEGERRIGK